MVSKEYLRDARDRVFAISDEYLNGYAKLCGINATGVYMSICRHANREQTCFPSKRLMAQELAISERSVYSAIKKLEEWGIIHIEEQGRKPDGSFKVRLYTLLKKECWKPKPQATGADGKIEQSPQANDDIGRRHVVPNKDTHMKDTHISIVADATEVFSFEEELQKMRDNPRKDIKVIALYWKMKDYKLENKDQLSKTLKRDLRAASMLTGYTGPQITKAMYHCQRSYDEWSLETVYKRITDIINKNA